MTLQPPYGSVIKSTPPDLEAAEERILSIIASTNRRDRDGDVIDQEGWKLDNYRKNPIVLWAHNYRQPAIGKCLELQQTTTQLQATLEFADTPFALEVLKLYRSRMQTSFSVHFLPIRWTQIMEGGQVKGLHFHEQELLEISAVPLPANPDALAKALAQATPSTVPWKEVANQIDQYFKLLKGESI